MCTWPSKVPWQGFPVGLHLWCDHCLLGVLAADAKGERGLWSSRPGTTPSSPSPPKPVPVLAPAVAMVLAAPLAVPLIVPAVSGCLLAPETFVPPPTPPPRERRLGLVLSLSRSALDGGVGVGGRAPGGLAVRATAAPSSPPTPGTGRRAPGRDSHILII